MNSRALGSTMCLLASLLLTGCLSGGKGGDDDTTTSSTTTTTQSQPLSGVVADGYIEGAVVFFDRNANGVLDSGEPVATTSSTGAFTLTGVPAADANKYRVLVAVQKTAKDADVVSIDGANVSTLTPNEYYLSSPPGKFAFISPLSTLVDMQMRANPSLTLAEAEADIKLKLGLTSSIGLFADYIADETKPSSTASESKKAHKLSRLLANALGKALDGVKATMKAEPSAANKARLFELSVNNVLNNLDQFVASAATLPDAPANAKPTDLASVQSAVSSQGDKLKDYYVGSNLQKSGMILAQLAQTTEPKTQTIKTLLEDGVYSLQAQSDGTYSQVKISAATATTATATTAAAPIALDMAQLFNNTPTPTTERVQLLGTDGQWTSVDHLKDSLLLQGATLSYSGDVATMTMAGNAFAMRAISYDLAAKSLDYALLGNGVDIKDPSLVFADKSQAYRIFVMPQSDAYVLLKEGGVDSGSLTAFLADYAAGQKSYSHPIWSSNLKVRFVSGPDSGAIKLFDDKDKPLADRPDAVWQKIKANGVEMLVFSALPDDYHSARYFTPFVAVNAEGKVASGVILKKGMTIGSNLLLNKAAFDRIPGVTSPSR